MTALLPCPFCGGQAFLKWFGTKENGDETYYVECKDCEIATVVSLETEAIAAWNRRAPNGRKEFDSGAWDAFNQVLYWINTLDTQTIDKKTLYAAVMEMRPSAPTAAFAAGAEAMRERAAVVSRTWSYDAATAIRALPLPEEPTP